MKLSIVKIFSFFFLVLSIVSLNQWLISPISSTYFDFFFFFIFLIIILKVIKINHSIFLNYKDYFFLKIYIFWICFCAIRGLFISNVYWDYKNLIYNTFALLVIISIFSFSNRLVVLNVLKYWLKYSIFIFVILVPFLTPIGYGYFLVPLTLLGLFFPYLNFNLKVYIIFATLFVILADFSSRANVLKFIIPFILIILYYFPSLLMNKFSKNFLYIVILLFPFTLFGFGFFGIFNIFKMEDYISSDLKVTTVINGQVIEESLKTDTRTNLYVEVLNSAFINNYILLGRTPARGNDSNLFGSYLAEELGVNRYERYSNEVSILNVFTWTGLIGVILYFLLFAKAFYLALFKSNNFFIKVVGLYVGIRWVFAWVEDFNRFDSMNMMLMMCLGICYSKEFRFMSDLEFNNWLSFLSKKSFLLQYFKK
jgi:hypothetical protein